MWNIQTTDIFDDWFDSLREEDQANVLGVLLVLKIEGPKLSRPYVDTLNNSDMKNLKELRIQSFGKPLRILFAFDPNRTGILLCGGDKSKNPKRFYDEMIPKAVQEYRNHLRIISEG